MPHIPAVQLKIEQQLNGTYRLSRVFRARRSGEIVGVYRTKAEAEFAKKAVLNQHLRETTSWEDW